MFKIRIVIICFLAFHVNAVLGQVDFIVKPSLNVSWFNIHSKNLSSPYMVIARPGFGVNVDFELNENVDFGFGLEWNKIGGPIGLLKSFEGSDKDTLLNLSFDNVKQVGLVERYITIRSFQIPISFKIKKEVSNGEIHWFRFGTNLNYNLSGSSTDQIDFLYFQNPNTKEYVNSTRRREVYKRVDLKNNVAAFTMDLLFGLGVDVEVENIKFRVGVNYHQGLMNLYSDQGIEKDGLGDPMFSGSDNAPKEFSFSVRNNFAELFVSIFAF